MSTRDQLDGFLIRKPEAPPRASVEPRTGEYIAAHKKVSLAPDVGGPNTIKVSDWNDRHIFNGGTDGQVLTRDSGSLDGAVWADSGAMMAMSPSGPVTVANFDYNFSDETTPDTTTRAMVNGEVRLNSTDYTLVTRVWINRYDDDGEDQRTIHMLRLPGDLFRLEIYSNADRYVQYRLIQDPIDQGAFIELVVDYMHMGGDPFVPAEALSLFWGGAPVAFDAMWVGTAPPLNPKVELWADTNTDPPVLKALVEGTWVEVSSVGATGPAGPVGPQGDPGPPGPTGAPGQSAGRIFYMAPSNPSDIAGYATLLEAPSPGAEVIVPVTCTGTSDVPVGSFVTEPGVPGTVPWPAGTVFRRIFARVSGGSALLHVYVYKRESDGTEILVREETSPPFSNTVVALQDWTVTLPYPGIAMTDTDRLVCKVAAQRVGGPGSITVSCHFEGEYGSHIQTTISAGVQGPEGPAGPPGAPGAVGPAGPPGPPGITIGSLDYRYNDGLVAPPASGDVRFDAAYPYSAVTTLWISRFDNGGNDQRTLFLLRRPDERIRIEDHDNADTFATFTILAAPVDSGDHVTFSVAHAGDSGSALPTSMVSVYLGGPVAGSIPVTVIDAKGDLILGTGSDAVARLPIGLDGSVLTADATQPTGTKWAAPTATGGVTDVLWVGTSAPTDPTIELWADTDEPAPPWNTILPNNTFLQGYKADGTTPMNLIGTTTADDVIVGYQTAGSLFLGYEPLGDIRIGHGLAANKTVYLPRLTLDPWYLQVNSGGAFCLGKSPDDTQWAFALTDDPVKTAHVQNLSVNQRLTLAGETWHRIGGLDAIGAFGSQLQIGSTGTASIHVYPPITLASSVNIGGQLQLKENEWVYCAGAKAFLYDPGSYMQYFGHNTNASFNSEAGETTFHRTLRVNGALRMQPNQYLYAGDQVIYYYDGSYIVLGGWNRSVLCSSAFHVNGDVIKWGGSAYNYPDHIFTEPLAPLDEVEAFVREHHRLPNHTREDGAPLFTRADETEADLERLYLHLFALHKRVRELESR